MKKLIVLICSLVLVFSLVIPISAEENYNLVGSIQLKEDLDFSFINGLYAYDFYCNGIYYESINFVDNEEIYYLSNGVEVEVYNANYDNKWIEDYYRYIDFDDDFGSVTKEFYDFFTINDINNVINQPDEPLTDIQLLERNNEILTYIYTAQLFAIAVVVFVGVVFLLYKFLKLFY